MALIGQSNSKYPLLFTSEQLGINELKTSSFFVILSQCFSKHLKQLFTSLLVSVARGGYLNINHESPPLWSISRALIGLLNLRLPAHIP